MSLVLVIDSRGDQAPWSNQVLRRVGQEVILSTELPSGSLAGLLRPAAVLVNLDAGCSPDVKVGISFDPQVVEEFIKLDLTQYRELSE
jgi:hypothetical protein